MDILGIYGYECTKLNEFEGFKIIPRFSNHHIVKKLAKDQKTYHLTALLEVTSPLGYNEILELRHDLEGVLSFIDQREVLVTPFDEDYFYTELDTCYPRYSSGSAMIIDDLQSPESRYCFIHKALEALEHSKKYDQGNFREVFFKSVNTFRTRVPYVDISYYLLFSALESLARNYYQDFCSNAAQVIAELLQKYNFQLSEHNEQEPLKATSTYSHLRNSVFHNGVHTVTKNINGNMKTFELKTYLSPFQALVNLVIIKHIDFDDGWIDWDSWPTRNRFKIPKKNYICTCFNSDDTNC